MLFNDYDMKDIPFYGYDSDNVIKSERKGHQNLVILKSVLIC